MRAGYGICVRCILVTGYILFLGCFVIVLRQKLRYPGPSLSEEEPGTKRIESSPSSMVNHKKLRLIYHVGPPKMASTSIQFGAIERYRTILLQENFVIYNTQDATALNRCLHLDPDRCIKVGAEWHHFVSFLNKARKERKDIIMSTENYWPNIDLKIYHDILLKKHHFDVKIVVSYRRLFEFLPSVYFQLYRFRCGFAKGEVNQIPKFVDYLNHVNDTHRLEHPTKSTLEAFRVYFPQVEVFNIHPTNLVSRFLCHVLNATDACAQSRRDEKEDHYNSGHTLFYDRIAQHVQTLKLSKKEKQCKSIRDKVKSRQEDVFHKTWTDFSLICLSSVQSQWLKNQSFAYEQTLLPECVLCEKEHNDAFELASNSSLCDVDVDKVLEQDAWRNYFLPPGGS